MSRLVEALAREVGENALHRSTAATLVRRANAAYVVETEHGEALTADHVVVAVPPRAAASLLTPLDGALAAAAQGFQTASTATVIFVFPPDTRVPDSSGLLVPRTEGRATLAATFVNAKWARVSSTGEIVIRAFLGGARSPALLAETSDDDLAACALGDLRAYLPLPAPRRTTVVRFPHGTPQPEVGHRERVRALRALAADHPGISLVSAAYEGPGIAGCVAQAARLPLAVATACSTSDHVHRPTPAPDAARSVVVA
jgi:oxygen-dependent protoporphyrinogen oxidase